MGLLQHRLDEGGVVMARVRKYRWLPRSVQLQFWDHIRRGLPAKPAARAVGLAPATGVRLFRQAGGGVSNAPRRPGPIRLSLAERGEIARPEAAGPGPPAGRGGVRRPTP